MKNIALIYNFDYEHLRMTRKGRYQDHILSTFTNSCVENESQSIINQHNQHNQPTQ